MVDVDIFTLAETSSFDSSAVETALTSALHTVVSDSDIGIYHVDASGSVEVGTPVIGSR